MMVIHWAVGLVFGSIFVSVLVDAFIFCQIVYLTLFSHCRCTHFLSFDPFAKSRLESIHAPVFGHGELINFGGEEVLVLVSISNDQLAEVGANGSIGNSHAVANHEVWVGVAR